MAAVQTDVTALARLGVEVLPRLMRAVASRTFRGDGPPVASMTQFRLLRRLSERSWLTSELALSMKLSAPTVSAAVDSLVRQGLVERGEATGDRRAIPLHMTEKGVRSYEAALQRAHGALLQIIDRLSPADQVALETAMRAVSAVLEESENEGALNQSQK